jgi:hypothetical protein
MNDHHFSYPRVVPVQGATISGHAIEPSAPVVPLLPQPPIHQAAATASASRVSLAA